MKSLNTRSRVTALIKVGLLLTAPLLMITFYRLRIDKPSLCLFCPMGERFSVKYLMDGGTDFVSGQDVLEVLVDQKRTTVHHGNTLVWTGEVKRDGTAMTARAGGSTPAAANTIFWLAPPLSGSPFVSGFVKRAEGKRVMDLAGVLGEPGEVYAIEVGEYKKVWALMAASPSVREIYFADGSGRVLGSAEYDTMSGLLVEAVSYRSGRKSMVLSETDYPPRHLRFRSIFLTTALLIATGLVTWELFLKGLVKNADKREKSGLKWEIGVSSEFVVLGSLAALVDFYYDLLLYTYFGTPGLLLAHVGTIALIWLRLGKWALIPSLELGLALLFLVMFGEMTSAFAFFPGSFAAWLMALLEQGSLSPGAIPRFLMKKSKRR